MRRPGSILLPALFVLLRVGPARALDRFEIQVYEGDINRPGQVGLELHSNFAARNGSGAAAVPDSHRLWRNTLEPSVGVLPWWELGAYLQGALATANGDSSVYFGGFKLRSKFVVPHERTGDFVFGLNIEIGRGGAALGEAVWGSEFRPILAYGRDRLFVAVNPIFGWALSGDRHAAPDFEPAGKVRWDTRRGFALGVEYYAGLGLISQPLLAHAQEHVAFLAADLLDAGFELNVGLGRGLTSATDRWFLKMILGFGFW